MHHSNHEEPATTPLKLCINSDCPQSSFNMDYVILQGMDQSSSSSWTLMHLPLLGGILIHHKSDSAVVDPPMYGTNDRGANHYWWHVSIFMEHFWGGKKEGGAKWMVH